MLRYIWRRRVSSLWLLQFKKIQISRTIQIHRLIFAQWMILNVLPSFTSGIFLCLPMYAKIPATFHCWQRSVYEGIKGLCMLLRRLSYSCRYGDMIARFARPVPALSMITNTVLDYIYDLHGQRITQWNDGVMSPPQLQDMPMPFQQAVLH